MSAIRLNIAWVCLSVCGTCAIAQPYEAAGTVPASASIRTDDYSIEVTAPSANFKDKSWLRYTDTTTGRITVLVIGIPEIDTYALSVRPQGQVAETSGALGFLKAKYPDDEVVPSPENSDCAINPLGNPIRIGRDMVGYTAACMNPATRDLFELAISWKAYELGTPMYSALFAERAGPCFTGDQKACVGRYPEMSKSMRSFVGSFKFSGRK
ncbi:MAG: hypothetical protein ABI589_07140 [Burkholderiales bacterium]